MGELRQNRKELASSTPEMADPIRVQPGYKSQEVSLVYAKTSGFYWFRTKTSDLRQFSGAAKKTLQGQSLESVFAPETLTSKDVEVRELDTRH